MPYLDLVHFLKNVLVKIVSYGIFAKTAPLFSVETQCETVWTLLSTAHAVEKPCLLTNRTHEHRKYNSIKCNEMSISSGPNVTSDGKD